MWLLLGADLKKIRLIMSKKLPEILIINGPNLNLLGTREPSIYGSMTLKEIEKISIETAATLNMTVQFLQSNYEGQLIEWIQETVNNNISGIIINPAAFGHTSIALMDALKAVNLPVIEVHLSNIFKREDFRQHSYISLVANGIISGFNSQSYVLGLHALSSILQDK